MSRFCKGLLTYPARLWACVYQFLRKLAEKEVAAWGSELQYKRRFTNPDEAKRVRQVL